MNFQERPFEYTRVYSILSKLKFNLCFNLIVGNNDTIETLNISWNGFGPNGAKAIAKGLEVFRLLIFMSIKNMTQILNRHRNFFLHDCNRSHFSVQENSCLKVLDVSWNGLEDVGSEMIASAISANDVMVDLNISANRIGMKGLGLVLKALSSSKSIQSLNVSSFFDKNLSA